ncbi:regulator of G-protein signaling 13 [Leptonychotes weddellii]|uniref:Regulator of G-protein signaling 13 n=1 Tax=Leptonychotes weddellii TaxID=9713 RepID=A0A2U3XAM5_LEPWE|nr:regulator of G-protein signaling 13 [Leptonychotes weddellii]
MSRRKCWICKMCRDESKRLPSNNSISQICQETFQSPKEVLRVLIFNTENIWPSQRFALMCFCESLPNPLLQNSASIRKALFTYGPVVYAAYLKMEHSDENIKFWMACETYKKIASRRSRISRAKKLYKIYIQPQSPREINIDSSTRETIVRNIQEPTQTCFEEAQRIVYMHMERDSYPRFVKSEMYQKLLKTIQPNNNS